MNIQECERLIEKFHREKTQEMVGLHLNELTIEKQNVIIKKCKQCKKELRIKDNGLYEDNVALFWYMCKKDCPTSNYCAGIIPEEERENIEPYRFCYDETSILAIEKSIELCDYVRASDVASYNTLEITKHRIRQNKMVDMPFLQRILNGQLKSTLRSRKRMWAIINEGLRRLLVEPKKPSKNDLQYAQKIIKNNGLNIRAFHGHQLNDLIKRDKYSVLHSKEDILMFGHFHLLLVLLKYDTWIMITGHWTSYQNPRQIGFLSHIGGPILRVDNSGELQFILNRYPDVKSSLD